MVQPHPYSLRRLSTILLISSLSITSLVGWMSYDRFMSSQQSQLEHTAREGFQSLVQHLGAVEASLDALIGLYQASDEMDPGLFTPFSETLLQDFPFLKSIHYLSYLSDDELDEFIVDMQETGFTQFEIHRLRNPDTAVDWQPFYLVTSFVEPFTPTTARFMGAEWSAPGCLNDIPDIAAASGQSEMIKAPRFFGDTTHFLLIKPTYFGRTISDDAIERRQQLSGFFLIVINNDELISSAIRRRGQSNAVNFELSISSKRSANGPTLDENDGIMKIHEQIKIGASQVELTTSSPISLAVEDQQVILVATSITAFLCLLLSVGIISRYRITQQRNAIQSKLYKERERAQVTLKSIGDAVIATDVEQHITFINPMAEKLLQTSPEKTVGKPFDKVVQLKEMPSGFQIREPIEHFHEITEMRLKQTGIETSLYVNGGLVSVDVTVSELLDEDGAVIGWVMVLRDVSLERQLTNELVYQASHDMLTGLVNRSEFENKLKEALETSRQQDSQHALLYMDMDQFKLVNDTCGHTAGDDLLKQVAKMLNLQMRKRDLVARLGGDEFGVLLFSCNQDKAQEVAERIRKSLNDFHFSWEGKYFDVSASIGLVMINRDSSSLTDLLSCADLACYAAKDAGRNMVHCYHADDEDIAKNFSQMQWLPRIKDALVNNEFALALQPIVSLREEQSPQAIYEFLIRWPQTDGSFVSPALFIPSAERYDLMREIDRWVISNALHALPRIVEKLDPQGEVLFTINLSGQSVGDPDLSDFMLRAFQTSGVNTELVCFEVTETVAIANFATANEFISQLRGRGCRFALDDFGSGLSSFGYLKSLPLDFLKIDGLFIRDMMKDEVDTAMVRTINDIAKVLKLQTIAEWVEDAEVANALREIGIDYAQGYFFDKPFLIQDLIG